MAIAALKTGTDYADLDNLEDPRISTAFQMRPTRKRTSKVRLHGTYKPVINVNRDYVEIEFEELPARVDDPLPELACTRQAELASDSIAVGGAHDIDFGAFVFLCSAGTAVPDTENIQRLYLADKLYALDKRNPRLAIDFIVDHLDELQQEGDFEESDEILSSLNAEKLSDPTLVSILGITSAAIKEFSLLRMTGRHAFYKRAFDVVASRRGVDGANKLLTKYR